MATFSDWVEGARLRTLPQSAAPVIVGTGAAVRLGAWSPARSLLALGVALLLQIGVNFANDYSDGIRGSDDNRQGPPRLTGGGLAAPRTVLAAALGCFGAAGALGLWLVALSGHWWLLAVGAAAVAAAWFYTGGPDPYGYWGIGFSELMVFAFFGPVATIGTSYTQSASVPWWLWVAGCAMGVLSVGLLTVNNIRDIPGDQASGKRTLPARLGQRPSRIAYAALLVGGVALAVVAIPGEAEVRWAIGIALLALALVPIEPVARGLRGRDLIPPLRNTGLFTLVYGLCVGILFAGA